MILGWGAIFSVEDGDGGGGDRDDGMGDDGRWMTCVYPDKSQRRMLYSRRI